MAWLLPRRPVAAVGLTFMLAALSRVTVELPLGTMRLEQPALAGLVVLTVWHRRALDLPPLRPLLPIVAAGLVYLASLALSSATVATDPAASLRLTAWTALSMAGGLAAALLLAGRATRALAWLSSSAGVLGGVGLLSGVAYLLFAVGRPWVDNAGTDMPRVSAFVLEPNLYASLLAAAIPLALERWRARPTTTALVIAGLLLAAMGLGVTRGAYVGLAVGLPIYFALVLWRMRDSTRLRALAAVVVVAGGAGLVMPRLLLDSHQSGLLVGRPRSGVVAPANPNGEFETFAYRMERVRIGLDDWRASPLIGLGAYSYGQSHVAKDGTPETIAVWPILALHDAGLIGLGGLLTLLGLLAARLWQAAGDPARGSTAIAFGAAVVVLLVAYLATAALHFAVTWLIIGGALAATVRAPAHEGTVHAPQPQGGLAWRITAPLTERSRRHRFQTFMILMTPRESDRVLDVGVNDSTWRSSNFLEASYPWPSRITAVALSSAPAFAAAFPEVDLAVADGRALPFADGQFDICFSNAVVEHVGSRDEQRRFVAELTRVARRVFVCTPNAGFPIDPHTLLPFAHWLPRRWWHALLRATGNGRWADEQLLNPLSARDLALLFPPGVALRIERQRMFGLTSVLIAIAERQTA